MTTAETIRIEIPIETIDNTDPALSNATKKLDKFGDAADKAGQSVDRTRGYVSKFDEQADKTQKSLAKWAKEKYEVALEAKEKITPVLTALGGNLRSLTSKTWGFTLKALDFATAPIRTVLNLLKNPLLQAGAFFGVSFGLTDTVNTQKDFEAAMSQVQAVSGATGDELTQLTKKAERMGATTKFTATESAEAFNYMAMAGWKSEEMMDGIEGILNLAAASNEDLGTTSDIVTDALTAFGLKASDAGMFSDVLAAASSNANTNVSMMGETFKYAASMAGSLGYSIQDVALMTGLMANSGIKASMAGTSLNMIMTRLSTNTGHALDTLQSLGIQFFDSKGNARALADVIEELRDATANMNDEQKSSVANAIAGTGAQKGLLAILNASETDYNKLANAIDNAAGASERMADTQLDNLSGSITLLQSAVDGVKISFGKRLNPYVRSIADGLTASMPQIESALNDFMDFVDRKYDRLQAKVNAMTATEEWQNADFGGKVSIAWNEIVADPFKEWWGTTGKSILSDIASDIGSGIGSGLGAGLMMLLGIDVSDSVNEGASVGKAFATGFAEGFDFDTIKEHLFSGLGNLVTSAGKLLPGGKSADLGSVVSAAIIAKAAMPVMSVGGDVLKVGKSVFGAQESLGGASLAGTILGSANAGTGLMGLGANAAIGLGAGNLSATASLGAGALGALGLGAIAGGATGGVSAISGIIDLYKAQRSNDEEYQKAYTSAGAAKLTGVAGGAAAGAMIGSIVPGVGTAVGGLIGAGLGGIAGFAESKRIKKEYEESAKASTLVTEKMQKVYDLTGYSVENVNFKTQALTDAMNDADVSAEQFGSMLQNAVSNDIVEHFGDLHLSLEEIKEAASTIAFDGMEGKFDSYTAQAQKAKSTLTSLKAAVSDLDKENWKMSLGMTVTEADIKEYRSSVSTMVSSTADYLQNKHYEANLALKLIMGDAADTTMLDSTYASFRNQLDDLSDKLSTAIDANIKLNGGVLKLDGDSEILSLQQQIQDITSQVSTAEENAKFDAIKIKYGGAALDAESFTSMQEELKNAVSSMTSQYDDALEVSLTNLRLQLDTGAIDQDEFYRQVQTLTDGYHAQISDLQVRVESFQLDSIAEAYSDALDGILPNLKGTTSEKLQQAMDAALKDNPNVAEWTNSDVVEWFDLNGMDAETQAAVIDLLKSVADSMPASFADSIRGSGLGDAARDATSDELDAISDTPFEKDAYVNVKPHVTVSSTYSASSGLFSSSPAASSSYSYTSPVTGKTVTPYAAGNHSMSIGGHASGGMVNGRELSWVGEEGPEMIIPLVPGRRERAVELYQQAGEILGITAHANGGLVGAGSTGSLTSYNALSSETLNYLTQSVNDAPIDSHALSEDYSSSINNSNTQSSTQQTTVQPNVTVKVEVSPEFNISGGGQSDDEIVAVIRRHMGDVTDELCGKIASKLEEVFANMPLKGVGV